MYSICMDEARCGAVCPGKFVPVLMFEGQTCSHISGHLPPGVLVIGLNDRTQIQAVSSDSMVTTASRSKAEAIDVRTVTPSSALVAANVRFHTLT